MDIIDIICIYLRVLDYNMCKCTDSQYSPQAENDDGIWLKLSSEDIKKYGSSADSDGWTLAVGPSGRIFLTLDGDDSYLNQIIDTKAMPPTPQLFPSAASVFGTSQKSVFGTPIPPPLPPVFNFGGAKESLVKLKFGAADSTFPSTPQKEEGKKEDDDKKPLFSIGSGSGKGSGGQRPLRRRFGGRRSSPKSPSPTPVKEDTKEEDKDDTGNEEEQPPKAEEVKEVKPRPQGKQALSPAVAECQRAVFAAFLWQEGLVYDAIASASHLMRNPDMVKKLSEPKSPEKAEEKPSPEAPKEDEEKATEEKESSVDSPSTPSSAEKEFPILPPTLNHLVTFWDEISSTVIENSNAPFTPPKVPALAQELVKRYEEEKSEIEKRKKEKDKKVAFAGGGGAGSTLCELCNQTFPDPVTYHMKEAHPGCGKHASGWGYNSKGTFCSGWAGNCGDGGRGGSTWYLMCKPCHSKYLSAKDEAKKKTVKAPPLPKMKTKKPGKPRSLPSLTAVQGMIQNAKFLLEIARISDSTPTTPVTVKLPALTELKTDGIERQLSSPSPDEKPPQLAKADSVQNEPSSLEPQRPTYLRSKSVAAGKLKEEESQPASKKLDNPLMYKPSKNLRKLMYSRSRQGPNAKETGYNRVMGFLLLYHDLDGLRASMKQSMRVAGVRAYALEVPYIVYGWDLRL